MQFPCSALNVKVVQNKRGQTTGETMTLIMVATSALNVKVVQNKRGTTAGVTMTLLYVLCCVRSHLLHVHTQKDVHVGVTLFNMKPLWKVKGFEQQTSWKVRVLDCVFHDKMSKKNDADIFIYMYMFSVILRVCATHHNHTQPHTTTHTNTHTTKHTNKTSTTHQHTPHTQTLPIPTTHTHTHSHYTQHTPHPE